MFLIKKEVVCDKCLKPFNWGSTVEVVSVSRVTHTKDIIEKLEQGDFPGPCIIKHYHAFCNVVTG